MPETILVFDFGTTLFKAGVLSPSGSILALARQPTPIAPSPAFREISVSAFRETVRVLCRDLARQRPAGLSDVAAVTFSTQANTFALFDEQDEPLTPFIVWDDRRGCAFAGELREWSNDADFVSRSGMPVLNEQFCVGKLRWLGTHQPETLSRARRLNFLGDAFARWLTGRHLVDGSIAGLTGLFDVLNWRWESDWVSRVGVPLACLPTVVRGGVIVGSVLGGVAEWLGILPGAQVVMGLLDQHAGAIGVGNGDAGRFSETTGTVLASVRCSETFASLPGTNVFRGPAPDPERFFHMVFGDVSAGLLEAYRLALTGAPSAASLDEAVDMDAPETLALDESEDPIRLRERVRTWAREQNRADVVVCIYRAVARALNAQIRALSGADVPSCILCGGGGAQSRKWLQIKADLIGIPVLAPRTEEPALIGAGSLAARALGWDGFVVSGNDVPDSRLIRPRRGGTR